MSWQKLLQIKKDYKKVSKKLKTYLKTVYSTHKQVTAYHFRKAVEYFQGYFVEGRNYFSFFYNGNEYTVIHLNGQLLLSNKILYFSDNSIGYELIL